MSIGELRLGVDLMDTTSYQQIVQRVAAAAKGRKQGQWIAGHGWHESKWTRKPPVSVRNFPTHAALSAAVPTTLWCSIAPTATHCWSTPRR